MKTYCKARPRHTPGVMNKLESRYEARLKMLPAKGDILFYSFEAIKLKLAPNTFYTPDFFVVDKDGEAQFHEVKGHWEDAARVKIKVAASNLPFRFFAVTEHKRSFVYETI